MNPIPGFDSAAAPRFAAVIQQVAEFSARPDGWAERIKIALLRDCSLEQLVPYVQWRCFSEGIRPEVELGAFDAIADDLLGAGGLAARMSPDLIVVSTHAPLGELLAPGGPERRLEKTRALLASLDTYCGRNQALVAVATLVAPSVEFSGQARAADGVGALIAAANGLIRDFARAHPGRVVVCDLGMLARRLGLSESFDRRSEMKFGAPYRPAFLDAYAAEIARAAFALKGRSRKCIVLDCDNTLWGGIVGEDGLEGIRLDPREYPGCAYYQFQQALLRLRERGFLLALCSRNEEADVLAVLTNHPHCLLKRSHLAAWRVNWERKSANLVALADELRIAPESMVLVEDNGAEIAEVRAHLPAVATIPVPTGELFRLPELLFGLPQLDQLQVSREDGLRSQFFSEERKRADLKEGFGDELDYLRALEVRARVRRALPGEAPRIAQLTQRTNQFNLSPRRLSEAEVEAIMTAPDRAVFTLEAGDRFGEYGLTGVLVAKNEGAFGRVETLLLSCRVLSRRLEIALVRRALEALAGEWGLSEWRAEYVATAKNRPAAEFWPRAGFAPSGGGPERREYTRSGIAEGWEDTDFIGLSHE